MLEIVSSLSNESKEEKIKQISDFTKWCINAKPNDKYIYFTGFGLQDTFITIELQQITYKYAERGLVYLVQQKLKAREYNFIAVKAGYPPLWKLIPNPRESKSPTVSKPRIQKRVLIPTEHLSTQGLN